ncbi:DNA methylase family protein [Yersinia rohdei]|uniref:site-specific DNA-methyltransferase (adenine-specific) n=1 Tax=Yersinia rohdei TaxID=29485 RepID=A0ABM5SES9_YERRO|nr:MULTISPECIES: site-specific DNA-methyltransferase [Enterobacterales]AJJ11820.1 DNA methylase family protein [Yersinia rohdei]EEQ03105.1 Site-specific DNA-methyltransferase (Adenine-specific) [Yersinia rohdei ATCC 43380]MDT7299063.1 site-specific DNA-methyltransferase [Citrobacter freundii]QLV67025.1 site-specific DNA-methyltransferase [Citrobacter sp. RHBSTW-00570]
MEKLKMHSPNLTQDNIARLRDLFPGCVTEAKGEDGSVKLAVDFDQLRQELAESIVEGPQERYHLNWPGKREALLTANAPIAKTLRPFRDESVDFDTTKNLFIEGDNLDALKLLQETYLGKVKMIYIDPPYNTGRDFIYDDDYSADVEGYQLASGQVNQTGGKLVANTEANGRYHSDWLSMIYARLRLARNLLKDDGVIFMSIDDNEVDNLRKVASEVFGDENFVAQVIWQKVFSPKNSARWFSEDHDYVLVYAKNGDSWSPNLLPQTDDMIARYKNPDNDPRGVWQSDNLTARNRYDAGLYSVKCPSGRVIEGPPKGSYWRVSESNFKKLDVDNRIWWGADGDNMPRLKRFLTEVKQGKTPQTLWFYKEVGHTQDAKKTLLKYVQFEETENVLNSVKPVELLQRILQLATSPSSDDIVLDFFSGSATTAHAVIKQNAEDGGNRRFIAVQIAEPLPTPEPAMASIFEMGLKRVRNVAMELRQQSSTSQLDLGFRVLKIESSNMADVYYSPDALDNAKFDLFVDNIKPDRTPEDLLFQVMLDWGVDLALPIAKQSIQGKDVFFVDGNVLAACFDASGSIDEAFVKELAKRQPLRVVFRDAGYKNSAVKINVEQIFKLLSPVTEVKCI